MQHPARPIARFTNNYSVDDSSGVVELSERYNDARKETFEEWLDARRAKITDEIQEAQSSQESAELEMGEESFENFSARRFSSPSKDNFDYGGFVESPSQQESDQSRGSSPFEPEEVSTTPHLQPPAAQRLQGRARLPRSPLFLAQNASSSPEHRPIASLTPRVVSHVATHNAPVFSFDDSERSSVAYEQERALSSSTTDSRPRPSESLNLRQELRGSSLQSSRIPSFASSFRSDLPPLHDQTISAQSGEIENGAGFNQRTRDEEMGPHSLSLIAEQSVISTSTSNDPSRELTLPPPFSTISRSVSRAGSLPSSPPDGYPNRPSLSSIIRSSSGGPSVSPSRDVSISSSVISQLIREHEEKQTSSPPSGGHRRQNPIVRAAARLFSSSRSRSPRRNSPPPSPSPSPRRRRVRLQPTPTPTPTRENSAQRRMHEADTRWVRRRSGSPAGMSDDGFQGLYGGVENGDDEQSWIDGVRARNAEMRTWQIRASEAEFDDDE
ncbi:hypothetical protein EYC84_009718 [Monilinia fructicola]|uniref:Uncharacterized protein n=1 Tax=Monilinia fructicola TaxID=38448 RepID=A0A5M9JAV6_MONFR|nr:hypothetical protein EYC84_009718 [Monilinia fructicola]